MNEKEKQAIERLERGTTDSYVIIKKDVRILLNLIEKQQAELEKKDKIIDEMADFMWDYDCCSNFPQEYCKDCCDLGQGKQCIKEYFKKKVETEEK